MRKVNIQKYKDLFNTNLEGVNFNEVLNGETLIKELEAFDKSTKDQTNYTPMTKMETWDHYEYARSSQKRNTAMRWFTK
jgi:hypothetical protein